MLSSIIGSVTIVADPIIGCQTNERRINMLFSDVDAIAKAASNKAELCNNHFGKYFMRSIMAGFYIVVATILSNVSAAVLLPTYPQFGKLLGAFILSGLFVYSKASHAIMVDYYNSFIYSKISAGSMELLVRGILCNFLVCMAVLVGTKLKTESGKLIIMFCIIMAFVVAGFEHCIANMSTFSIGYMLLGDIGTASVIKSMIMVTIGNMLGGAVLLGVPVQIMKAEH